MLSDHFLKRDAYRIECEIERIEAVMQLERDRAIAALGENMFSRAEDHCSELVNLESKLEDLRLDLREAND